MERGHKRKISFAELHQTIGAPPLQHAPGPVHQQQQMSQAQAEQMRLEQIRRADQARRQSKKPTDREIPEELSDVIVGDGVDRYKNLRDVERRLDAVMMRKRLDIADNVGRHHTKREGVMRIWISNSAEGQPWEDSMDGAVGFAEDGTFDFGENNQATYRVRIESRLLQDPDFDSESTEEEKEGRTQRPRLSSFFKSIKINFDRNPALQPDGFSAIEWQKPSPSSPNYDPNGSEASFDTLEFERKGDENINVTIELTRDLKHERFKFSPELAAVLDTDEDDRAGAVQGIWEYCRARGLQDDDDKRIIRCDGPLQRVYQPHPYLHILLC
jgi:SWI/SNF-related matrix-associated actin-dependent regulator of chromatin subfamily D